MINFHDVTNKYKIEHNANQSYIPQHPQRVLIIGCPDQEKANAFLNLKNHQPDIDEIYLYAKDPYKSKYEILIKKREKVGLQYCNDTKVFIEYSNDVQDVHKSIEE